MSERSTTRFRPGLERLEAKRPLSAGASAAVPLANPQAGSADPAGVVPVSAGQVPQNQGSPRRPARHVLHAPGAASTQAQPPISAAAVQPTTGFLVYRLTNPNSFNNKLVPPFGHVLVQARRPVPGQVYNVLQVAVRNGTAQTFDASSGFTVSVPGQAQRTPILTGNEQWKPGQDFIFYVLTKKYYPLPSQVTSGFEFFLGGAESTAIPGPSGIFLRLPYNPRKINGQLDWIVTQGPGAQGGKGIKFGLPDTAIYEFVSAKTRRPDFGGYF